VKEWMTFNEPWITCTLQVQYCTPAWWLLVHDLCYGEGIGWGWTQLHTCMAWLTSVELRQSLRHCL
jgi:hypothetical protein